MDLTTHLKPLSIDVSPTFELQIKKKSYVEEEFIYGILICILHNVFIVKCYVDSGGSI